MQERLAVMAEDIYTTKIMDATVAERHHNALRRSDGGACKV